MESVCSHLQNSHKQRAHKKLFNSFSVQFDNTRKFLFCHTSDANLSEKFVQHRKPYTLLLLKLSNNNISQAITTFHTCFIHLCVRNTTIVFHGIQLFNWLQPNRPLSCGEWTDEKKRTNRRMATIQRPLELVATSTLQCRY